MLPAGSTLHARTEVRNVADHGQTAQVPLVVDGAVVQTQAVQLAPGESRTVSFELKPTQGSHQIRIGDTSPATVKVYPHRQVRFTTTDLKKYCSGTAAPCRFDVDTEANRFRIEVAGTDFYHGEDSYGAAFLPAIHGNFIATAMIQGFGAKTHEWFRAGLFARNDMKESYAAGEGSLGSVLMFATPGRVGMNWDEHGDGCMHKAQSRNREPLGDCPIWLRLIRHGDSFTGYFSDDGQKWTKAASTESIPGLSDAIDIGLAAGGPDQRVYQVEFEDFTLEVEQTDSGE
jgi:regulation of enolase protein 1 (concanavalin A-like superfamily)